MAQMDIFNVNVENGWVTNTCTFFVFPYGSLICHSERMFLADSICDYLILCLCVLGNYSCIRRTGNIIEPLRSYLLNICLIN